MYSIVAASSKCIETPITSKLSADKYEASTGEKDELEAENLMISGKKRVVGTTEY